MLQQKLNVVIGVITNEKSQVLLAQRTPKQHLAGYWEFPGGKIEAEETAEQALHRELYEELGIVVISSDAWFEYEYAYPEKEINFSIWKINRFNEQPYGRENQLIGWYDVLQLNQLKVPPANKRIIFALENTYAKI